MRGSIHVWMFSETMYGGRKMRSYFRTIMQLQFHNSILLILLSFLWIKIAYYAWLNTTQFPVASFTPQFSENYRSIINAYMLENVAYSMCFFTNCALQSNENCWMHKERRDFVVTFYFFGRFLLTLNLISVLINFLSSFFSLDSSYITKYARRIKLKDGFCTTLVSIFQFFDRTTVVLSFSSEVDNCQIRVLELRLTLHITLQKGIFWNKEKP